MRRRSPEVPSGRRARRVRPMSVDDAAREQATGDTCCDRVGARAHRRDRRSWRGWLHPVPRLPPRARPKHPTTCSNRPQHRPLVLAATLTKPRTACPSLPDRRRRRPVRATAARGAGEPRSGSCRPPQTSGRDDREFVRAEASATGDRRLRSPRSPDQGVRRYQPNAEQQLSLHPVTHARTRARSLARSTTTYPAAPLT